MADALALIHADMGRLDAGLGDADSKYLSVYGMLPLMGAVVAGRGGRTATARELLAFGPTNAGLHTVAVLVELGQVAEAVAVAEGIDPAGLDALPCERRACHLVDVARAEAARGRRGEALALLVEADRLAPEEVCCRPLGRDATGGLRDRWPQRVPAELANLATRAGLPV